MLKTVIPALATALILAPAPAMAYIGPGLGAGAIGAVFGVLAALVMAVVALFWYPLKRLVSRRKATPKEPT